MKPQQISYPIDTGFEVIGITRTAGYKAIKDGQLHTFKVGRRRMVTHRALLDYVGHLEARSDAHGGVA